MPHLVPIRELPATELLQWLASQDQPKFRAAQIQDWVYRKLATTPEEMANVPKDLRLLLAQNFDFCTTTPAETTRDDDGTVKWLLRLPDGNTIESVLIRAPERATVCISTQVGCAVHCVFCASGKQGFTRNLTAAEIIDQVVVASHEHGRLINNVVVMGMGEPLHNLDHLSAALETLCSPAGLGLGARHVTVSTSGIPQGIRRLADLQRPWNLAVSLHAPTDDLRARLIPSRHRHPIADILAACEYYRAATGRMVTLEYALLQGVNDSPELAGKLAAIARQLHAKVNLIPCNCPDGSFLPPERADCEKFLALLVSRGLQATIRRRKGFAIQAACGQLRQQADRGQATPPKP
ncbi:MAG: 23S rRNA (adenine(2503)-C(2))-methyltransferase RlmN [Lentisphaeria bacterium]|jgi:23S rRNA (adenine2503-C2)-methyltransferase|nr:23S rRNA (adenine(2503)-C(2))-methyltransferase RlmN [Lentisphaeria bacterium]